MNFKYINHPADLKIHSWGNSIEESFMNAILATVRYMVTPIENKIQNETKLFLSFKEKTYEDLLFSVIDSVISKTVFDFFVTFLIKDVCLTKEEDFLFIKMTLVGELFDETKHKEGVEVKAMTYGDISVSKEKPFDCFFILDI